MLIEFMEWANNNGWNVISTEEFSVVADDFYTFIGKITSGEIML